MRSLTTTSRRYLMWFGALGAAAVASACVPTDPAVGDCHVLLRTHYGEHQGETYTQFNTYDLETRYRLYICGRQAIHAPWSLQVPFARGGQEAAQFLAHKLEATDYADTIVDIVLVFATMRQMETFDASGDPELIALIERKVAGLEAPVREALQDDLEVIRDGATLKHH